MTFEGTFLMWCLCCLLLCTAQAATLKRPNFLILLADDQGYSDLSINGHPTIMTPNIDKLGFESVRFTQWYAGAAVCSPSRAALLTGRMPIRSGTQGGSYDGVKQGTFAADAIGGLPTNETTFATALQENGYHTAMVGKWHLGVRKQFMPLQHGFHEYFGVPYSTDMGSSWWQPRADSKAEPPIPLLNQSTIIEQPADLAKLTDKYVDYVDNFLKQRAAQGVQARQQQAAGTVEAEEEKPFLMYLAFNHVHVPNFCNDRFVGTSRRGPFGDSSTELDEAVGSVMDSLKKYGFDENTVVIYTSDNGPWLMQGLAGGSSGVFYEGKATTWEGGLRVPGFVRWKGVIEPRISMELSSTLDIFPTILSLAGVEQPQDRVIDGQDLTPLLFSKLASTKHTCLFLYKGTPMDEEHPGLWAVRCGPYKMHYISTNSWQSKHIVYDPPQLYNVETDPSESRPLDVTQYAKVLRQMEEQVAEHQLTLNQVPNQMGRGGNLQYRVCCDDQSQEHGLPQYPECTCSPGNWEHS